MDKPSNPKEGEAPSGDAPSLEKKLTDQKATPSGDTPSLETKVADLEKKLADQNASAKRTAESKTKLESELLEAQKKIKDLESKPSEPKEDTDRIADLEMRLARSEAVAEYGLDADDVAMFKGTPDDIKEQTAHFASKLAPKQETTDNNSEETPPTDPPKQEDPPADPPKPKGKEMSNLERYKRANPEERRIMMEKAKRGDIDLAN
jgi:uncharacterized coiled-coil protein SlyX